MIELKPCPFCGFPTAKITEKRSGNYRRTGDMYQVLCAKCKARGPICTAKYTRTGEFGRYDYTRNPEDQAAAKQKAADAWNRRTEDDNP